MTLPDKEQLREMRELSGLSREEWGERLGVSVHTIQSQELGRKALTKTQYLLMKKIYKKIVDRVMCT